MNCANCGRILTSAGCTHCDVAYKPAEPKGDDNLEMDAFTRLPPEPKGDDKNNSHIADSPSVSKGMEEPKPRINSRAMEILDDLKISAYFSGLSNERLFDALCERIEEPSPLGTESPEMKAILCEICGCGFDWTEQKLRDVARWVNRFVWRSVPFAEYQRSKKKKKDSIYDAQQGLFV